MLKNVLFPALLLTGSLAGAEPVTYKVDPGHTVANFEVLHFNTSSNRGRLMAKEGSIVIDRKAKSGKADVTLDANTLSVAVPAFETTLKGARLFNVSQFAAVRFVGDAFTFEGDKIASVSGMLTMLDKTQPVTLKAVRFNCYENGQLKREVCGGDFETTVQRSQYGLGFLPNVAPEDVKILLQIEAIQQ